MTEIKKIGILTSGGDCAGLNAVVLQPSWAGKFMAYTTERTG